jgi:hypothetical protein
MSTVLSGEKGDRTLFARVNVKAFGCVRVPAADFSFDT